MRSRNVGLGTGDWGLGTKSRASCFSALSTSLRDTFFSRFRPLRSMRALRETSFHSSDAPLEERRAVRVGDRRRTRRRELVSVSCGVGAEFASVLR